MKQRLVTSSSAAVVAIAVVLIVAGTLDAQRRGSGRRSESSSENRQSSRSGPSGSSASSSSSSGTSSSASASSSSTSSASFSDRYGIVVDKNIFLRNRPRVSRGGSPPPRAPSRPEETHVLRGITLQDGRNVAFVENTVTRETRRLLPGDTVGDGSGIGKVVAVDINSLEFESSGERSRISVGRNFFNEIPAASAAPAPPPVVVVQPSPGATTAPSVAGPVNVTVPGAPPTETTTAAPAAAAPLAGDAGLSVEERMKLQRLKDLGQAQ